MANELNCSPVEKLI